MKRHKYLKIKKATQISKNQATSPNQVSVLQWFEEYITCIIKKYNIVDPRHMWNIDETNVTYIPKEKKFVGLLGKKLNQVVGSERVETSTVFLHVYPKQKVVDNNIIKCFGSDTILCLCTRWKFSINYVLINVLKTGGMLICFYEILCLDQ